MPANSVSWTRESELTFRLNLASVAGVKRNRRRGDWERGFLTFLPPLPPPHLRRQRRLGQIVHARQSNFFMEQAATGNFLGLMEFWFFSDKNDILLLIEKKKTKTSYSGIMIVSSFVKCELTRPQLSQRCMFPEGSSFLPRLKEKTFRILGATFYTSSRFQFSSQTRYAG